jgi:hypothetical protein
MSIRIFLLASMVCCYMTAFPQAGEAGWEALFNGQDLKGWKKLNGEAGFVVENGEIVGISRLNTPNTFLAAGKTYGDFILEYEFWVDPLLNSGVQFRSLSRADYQNGRVHGYQAEIDPSERAYTGGIYDEARRGWLYPLSLNPMGRKAFRQGAWNHMRIQAIGPNIGIWVNSVNTANIIDDMTLEGLIALQVHSINHSSMEGRQVRWRDIRIRTQDLAAAAWSPHPAVPEENFIPNTLSEHEKRAGWRLLWDGKSSAGWRAAKAPGFPQQGWMINDGVLTIQASGGGEAEEYGDIITADQFSNFELKLEFKISEGANSGIKYFVDPELNKGRGSAIGLEYQILDDNRHPDAKMGVAGNRTMASLYDLIPAINLSVPGRGKEARGPGQWNQARIVTRGAKVEHWLNGNKVVEYERFTPMFRALVAYSKYREWPNFGEWTQGHILLQDHGDEVSFRSIKIREF